MHSCHVSCQHDNNMIIFPTLILYVLLQDGKLLSLEDKQVNLNYQSLLYFIDLHVASAT